MTPRKHASKPSPSRPSARSTRATRTRSSALAPCSSRSSEPSWSSTTCGCCGPTTSSPRTSRSTPSCTSCSTRPPSWPERPAPRAPPTSPRRRSCWTRSPRSTRSSGRPSRPDRPDPVRAPGGAPLPGAVSPRGRAAAVSVLVVTGTGTGVGKTVVTAAVAALAAARGSRVAVVKPAQTGVGPDEPGDLDDVRRLAGVIDLHEHRRLRDPLSPAAAARSEGVPPLDVTASAHQVRVLAGDRDLVVVEGAGGLLVRFDDDGATVADLAREVGGSVLVVVEPGLGTLNHTALTLEAMANRGLPL